ncbi:hypothetical protein [Streptomyces sp. VRA16 Mangrove soil]|uniref:hypothetical protein n=1 Tax=Streptomyces sp. VRA16 Mangrove soil TaxID=2817434 RepID=UPI001A9EB1DD|nr:hypothetical protein [Streptomyces sp. VRA16 Mangrove soil]MBO1332325.1 hypothetical protein [Streptomyces sp. VRA16 Mangrove soil]
MGARQRFGGRVLLGVVAVVAMTATGCGGGGDKSDEVASAGGGRTSADTSKQASSELSAYVEGQRKWVKCLRDAGFDAPDPDAKGKVDLGDASKWKKDPTALKAQEKCADQVPPLPESVEKGQQPELSKAEIAKNQTYAKCMQEHGAPDFPDTDETGHFRDVTWDSTSAGGKRATRECASVIGIPADAPSPKG